MKTAKLGLLVVLVLGLAGTRSYAQESAVLDQLTLNALDGSETDPEAYRGKVLLIVNVASKCGLTPQYAGLQGLHEQYADQGLAVLGFPCNQFGRQEPGDATQIQSFCQENYGVGFDMFEKVEVNGDGACELYKFLTAQATEPQGPGDISWNFEKFLIGRDGTVLARFSPRTQPNDPKLTEAIEAALSAS